MPAHMRRDLGHLDTVNLVVLLDDRWDPAAYDIILLYADQFGDGSKLVHKLKTTGTEEERYTLLKTWMNQGVVVYFGLIFSFSFIDRK